jgi:Ala-tRNA(Pro) deacylase
MAEQAKVAMAETVKNYLASQAVGYQLVPHPHSQSSRETAAAAHVPDDHIAKAVILKDERGFLMAVIPGNHWIKLHAVQQELGRMLGLATEAEISGLFKDCQVGAIPPLGSAYALETLLDEELSTRVTVYFESGDHEHLVQVSGEDFRHLLRGARHGYFSHAR